MKTHFHVSKILLGLAAVSTGCGQSDDGYVDFDKTAPTQEHDVSVNPEPDVASSEPDKVIPANATNGTDAVNQAVATKAGSKTDQTASGVPSEADLKSPSPPASTEDTALPTALPAELLTTDKNSADSATGTPKLVVSSQSGLQGRADNPLVENSSLSEPLKIELLIPEKSFRKERGTNALRITYDDIDLLKIVNMEPVPVDAAEYFPEWLKSLDGKSIRIRGFMYPTFEATGLTEFTLARDNGICCFVRQPKIYDIIGVELADGVVTDYIDGRPFDVEGTFHIEPLADEKDLYRLYRIDNARVLR